MTNFFLRKLLTLIAIITKFRNKLYRNTRIYEIKNILRIDAKGNFV